MKYPAKKPAKFLKLEPEPEPDIEAGYPAGSGFSRISGRFLHRVFLTTQLLTRNQNFLNISAPENIMLALALRCGL